MSTNFLFSRGFIRTLGTLALFLATDFGDYLESRPSVLQCRKFHAILDNMIHLWIGVISYSIVAPHPWTLDHSLLVVAVGASFIDLDHFIAARSLSPDAAMHADHRGIFHCTGLAAVLIAALYKYRPHWALLAAIAIIPHHFRDAERRGLYLIPFVPSIETPPLSKSFVRIFLPIFPWILNYFFAASILGGDQIISGASKNRILNV